MSKYTTEFRLEAARLVKNGQAAAVTAKILGMPQQTLDNWVRLSNRGQLISASDKPVSAEQMELARLRAAAGAGDDGARHLKKSDGVLCKGIAVKCAWIAKHKSQWASGR